MNQSDNHHQWMERAAKVMPAGGFGNFDPGVILSHGQGSRVIDEQGLEYVDFLIGSGPMLVGHGHPEVLEVVSEQLSKGMTFFTNNTRGIELAEVICEAVPCADQLRYVSTGGEADMYAMRVARAHTGRSRILKFEGGYHGMSAEALMSLAPDTLVNFPQAVPDSAGIPVTVRDEMVIAPFNDIDTTRQFLDEYGDELAAVIVEPLQRLIPPEPGFLEMLRKETQDRGIVLIFDEVVTGFRLDYGGAQSLYGVVPDLCTLGKVIGGGFPLAAIAGRRELMAHFDRELSGTDGFLFQVGTLSGNPVAAVAGLKTLEILRRPDSYALLREHGNTVIAALRTHLEKVGVAHQIVGDPVLFDVVFTGNPVSDYRDTQKANSQQAAQFNATLREQGILKGPAKWYSSLSLEVRDLDQTVAAIEKAAAALVQ